MIRITQLHLEIREWVTALSDGYIFVRPTAIKSSVDIYVDDLCLYLRSIQVQMAAISSSSENPRSTPVHSAEAEPGYLTGCNHNSYSVGIFVLLL